MQQQQQQLYLYPTLIYILRLLINDYFKGSGTTHHSQLTTQSYTKPQKKKTVEKEIQQKKAKFASIKQGKAKACTKLSNNFPGGKGGGT